MMIDIMDLQDKVQDSMLHQDIPDHSVERAMDIVHEKVAVLIYCAQRIEHAIKSCQAWEGRNDSYVSDTVKRWLVETCATADLDRLCGVEVKAIHNKDRAQDPISLDVKFLYNDNPHFMFEAESQDEKQSDGAEEILALTAGH